MVERAQVGQQRAFSRIMISCLAATLVSLGPGSTLLRAQEPASTNEPRLYAPMYQGDFDAIGSGEAAILDFLAMLGGFGPLQCPSEPFVVEPGAPLPTDEST